MPATLFPPIPLNTARAAQAIYGKSNFYLVIGDQVDGLFAGLLLDDTMKKAWASGRSLAMLYLITIFQYMETLPDSQAEYALHERVDWKYALHLPLNYLSLEVRALCKLRRWLREDQVERQDFQTLLVRLAKRTAICDRLQFDLDAHQVITNVCLTSRLWRMWEALNQALEVLALRRPEWLVANSLPHWYERYNHVRRSLNLVKDQFEQSALAKSVGADGYYLLRAISVTGDPDLSGLIEVSRLRQIWQEEFQFADGQMYWNQEPCVRCSYPDDLALWDTNTDQKKRRWNIDD